jgi:hypothetical protein
MALEIRVSRDGSVRAIYSDRTAPLLASVGQVTVRRASHVEPLEDLSIEARAWLAQHGTVIPTALSWWADLLPVNGPVLGPFPARDAALAAELVWLEENKIPIPD